MKPIILITGGLGYVGARIAQYLNEQSPNFLLRLSTHNKNFIVPEALAKCEIIHMDLENESDIEKACLGVSTVIHLAAMNEHQCVTEPEKSLVINGLGTLKLLRASERQGVTCVIYFSTAHVYGSPLVGNISEETVPKSIHPYATTHKVAEDFVLAEHAKKKIRGLILRLSNSFGCPVSPHVKRWTLLVNDLCRQVVTEKKIVLHSSGLSQRDFITLDDVCRAVKHCLELKDNNCIGDGLFNLGSGCSLRVIDMAELIAERCEKVLGYKPIIQKANTNLKENLTDLNYCIEKIKDIGFIPLNNFQPEIDNTLRFCQHYFGDKQ